LHYSHISDQKGYVQIRFQRIKKKLASPHQLL